MDNENKFTITIDNKDKPVDGATVTPGDYTIETDLIAGGDYTYSVDTSVSGSDSVFSPTFSFDDYDPGPGTWPSEYDLKEMIEIYPALKIQYNKFIEVYNLVKDDYKGRKDADIPF